MSNDKGLEAGAQEPPSKRGFRKPMSQAPSGHGRQWGQRLACSASRLPLTCFVHERDCVVAELPQVTLAAFGHQDDTLCEAVASPSVSGPRPSPARSDRQAAS